MVEESTPTLIAWFDARPRWLQLAVRLVSSGKALDEEVLGKLEDACVRESRSAFDDELEPLDATAIETTPASEELRLTSLSEPKGINALSPRKPLQFGSSNVVIVYGHNGSGKSGYARILKHVCGARRPGKLHPNVFEPISGARGATVSFTKDGKDETRAWSVGDTPIADLRSVLIFDSEAAQAYLTEECEVVYEPRALELFTQLVEACEAVDRRIQVQQRAMPSRLPVFPAKYDGTKSGAWYKQLTEFTTPEDVSARCAWSETEAAEVLRIRALKVPSAASAIDAASELKHLEKLVANGRALHAALTDGAPETIARLRSALEGAEQAQRLAADKEFGGTALPGVGRDAWLSLWESARRYAEEHVHPGRVFPQITDEARCVLCQQTVDTETAARLVAFDSFVRGELARRATAAREALERAVDDLPQPQDDSELNMQLDAAGISDATTRSAFLSWYRALRTRRGVAATGVGTAGGGALPLPETIEQLVAPLLSNLHATAQATASADPTTDRATNARDLLELEARQWLSEQRPAIEAELGRKRQVAVLQRARESTATTALSRKKGELAEQLVSRAFQDRFQRELTSLRGHRIRVKLEKTRVERGHALHQIQVNAKNALPPLEVLSEGERRVISLAAFLADASSSPGITPFIFDDPISSLDQDFEEAVVARLVELAEHRQLIVFTHRLSLLVLLQEAAQGARIPVETFCVRSEPWGVGEPSDIPLDGKKPVSAIKKLRDERLAKARKVHQDQGHDEYAPLAKGICSDFRILLERLIETELLADVVQRFRRAINTKGKLQKLAYVTKADTDLFEALMTKYSVYEHSQPTEAPVEPLLPDELKADLDRTVAWYEEFVGRVSAAS